MHVSPSPTFGSSGLFTGGGPVAFNAKYMVRTCSMAFLGPAGGAGLTIEIRRHIMSNWINEDVLIINYRLLKSDFELLNTSEEIQAWAS